MSIIYCALILLLSIAMIAADSISKPSFLGSCIDMWCPDGYVCTYKSDTEVQASLFFIKALGVMSLMADGSNSTSESSSNALQTTQALNFPNETLIVTKSKKKFKIVDTLQKSIHRAVYVTSLPNSESKYVLKAEPPASHASGIRMEKAVAAALQCATPMEAERFAEFIDYGESKLVNFIIWKMLGPSLDELHQMYRQKFSLATSTRINVQTLRAISKLHSLGFIHRNIQPSHFVVGDSAKRVVYLISFSLVRSFKLSPKGTDIKRKAIKKPEGANDDSNLSIARESSSAQQYFAARFWYTSDAGSNLCRLDDIESWFYLSLHFINPDSIPWSKIPIQMLSDIYDAKKDLFLHIYSDDLFGVTKPIPAEYRRFIDEINASVPTHTPDYEKFISILTKVAHQACPNNNAPYDWEERPAPLLSDYGEFRVPVPSAATAPSGGLYSGKKPQNLGTDDPEMDRLVENWQNNFRKLILGGIPRAEAYRRVMGISHPPELATGHWKPVKPKKKKKKSKKNDKSVENTQERP